MNHTTLQNFISAGCISDEDLLSLLKTDAWDRELSSAADRIRRETYGTDVYIRGLIEFTNYCRNDCLYCGIRRSNKRVQRYRLTEEQILSCCEKGYALGFRTFVLQGGEDPLYSDEMICAVVQRIRRRFPDCAITLSIGEKEPESYRAFKKAGADRYLLRHETADCAHYAMLHPAELSLSHRMNCLFTLKGLGYQTGSGFMVGSPFQKPEYLVKDLRFLQKLDPAMIGIGPFLPHPETPFADSEKGSLALTIRLIAILRILFPKALIPATTALGTLSAKGRELALLGGANVIMPNLSPSEQREHYSLYADKIKTGIETAEGLHDLKEHVRSLGYQIVVDRGDARLF